MKIEYKRRRIKVNWSGVGPLIRTEIKTKYETKYIMVKSQDYYLMIMGDRYVDGVFDSRYIQYTVYPHADIKR